MEQILESAIFKNAESGVTQQHIFTYMLSKISFIVHKSVRIE